MTKQWKPIVGQPYFYFCIGNSQNGICERIFKDDYLDSHNEEHSNAFPTFGKARLTYEKIKRVLKRSKKS